MHLARAQQLALKIVAELLPYCEKLDMAGSVRRQCNQVNDIDLVLISKNRLLKPIVDRVTKSWRQVAGEKGDAQNLRLMSRNDFQLDLFIAHGEVVDLVSSTPTNWAQSISAGPAVGFITSSCAHMRTPKALVYSLADCLSNLGSQNRSPCPLHLVARYFATRTVLRVSPNNQSVAYLIADYSLPCVPIHA